MTYYDALCLDAERQRDEARAEIAIAEATNLIDAGEADGAAGLPSRFPDDFRYWSGYCDGARHYWLQKCDRSRFLPDEF